MAGTLTKIGVGSALFAMIIVVFLFFMVQMGNRYSASVESQYSVSDYGGLAGNVTSDYQVISEGASINQQASDTAQLQEKVTSESEKIGYWSIMTSAVNDFARMFPVHPIIWATMIIIMTLLGTGAIIYLIFGRVP